MIIRIMDIDEAIKLVGEYGRVQKAVFWSMAIPQLFLAWNHLLNVFVGATPEFVCIIDDSTSVKGCSPDPLKSPCKMYSYRASDFTSISSEVIFSIFFSYKWFFKAVMSNKFAVGFGLRLGLQNRSGTVCVHGRSAPGQLHRGVLGRQQRQKTDLHSRSFWNVLLWSVGHYSQFIQPVHFYQIFGRYDCKLLVNVF